MNTDNTNTDFNNDNSFDDPNEGVLDFNLDESAFLDNEGGEDYDDLSDPNLRKKTSKVDNLDQKGDREENEEFNRDDEFDQDDGLDQNDEEDFDEDQEEDDYDEEDYDDYTPAALLAKALQEEGLELFEEVDKDLDSQKLIGGLGQFISRTVDTQVNGALKELGEHAKYIRFLESGGNPEDIKPAVQSRKYADFDVDNPDVTQEDMMEVAKAMYIKRGADEEMAESMARTALSEGKLKEVAKQSSQFHKEYISNIEQQALASWQAQKQRQEELQKQEAEKFAQVLSSGNIMGVPVDRDMAAAIYDTMHKRDQVINYTDENGNPKRELLTKYEVEMYKAVNDPSKLALLNYLIVNDFDISSLASVAKKTNNSRAIDALDRKRGKSDRGGRKRRRTSPNSPEEILTEIDL